MKSPVQTIKVGTGDFFVMKIVGVYENNEVGRKSYWEFRINIVFQ